VEGDALHVESVDWRTVGMIVARAGTLGDGVHSLGLRS
jgi:hypothetical protein